MGVLRSRPGRPLVAAGALLLFTVAAVVINAISPVIPWVLLWLPGILGAAVLGVDSLRTARTEHLPAQVRRFWGHIALVCVPVGLGNAAQAHHMLTAPDPAHAGAGVGQIGFQGVAVVLVMYALLRLPFGQQSRGELFRVVLDAGTVMLACAVFLWHFSARYALEDGDRGMLFPSLALSLLALLAVFAVAKFLLTSHNHMDAGALRMIGIAVAIGAVGPVLRPLFEPLDPHLFPDMIDLPALFFCAVLATHRQRNAPTGPLRGAKPVRRRPFSFLPYVAVAAVDGLLLAVVWNDNSSDRRIVVVAAVLLTAVVVVRQITAFQDNGRLLRRLDHGATHDALTQLPNRVLFHERLRRAVEAADARPVAVALIDLDDFKEVNDTLGHEVGDQLLIAVAQRLNGCVRAEDTVARLGGDEFVVVLDGADPEAADLAARRMIEALKAPVLVDGHELPIRASIGIADGRAGDDPSVLLRQADIAMYAAKAVAGTASLHYEPELGATSAGHADLGADLPAAIRDDQLFLLFQPIVTLDEGRRVLGAEALVRWAHPVHGTLAPDAFIPVAERTGLIVPLSRWVLRAALTRMADWPAGTVLNINISARDLREPDFAPYVAGLLGEHGVAAGRITLEVTESMPVEPGESHAVLSDLRALGVKFALDDFGTGSSTLSLLHDVPVDEVKLDRSFTQAAPGDRITVAAGVAHLAQALSLHAVAEGVETDDQAARLRALGYRAAQGYLFARPMPAADFEALLPLSSAHG
ncbi:putative bifunctional diguanylate cyclase/phosphodiesterase [Paractinoplanes lichenicola]|uniref:EAL domain-containing protein n=1 Tax=Paractinoplanes lichenicola TaxID=2802976 RepID=A0ABS1VRM9_9ACTN|nr:EAL domain-containing protein [Actinoplanes lichenicola]MBL7257364.1 EAL domain-containing protein [Actinoplanes lichenicola]